MRLGLQHPIKVSCKALQRLLGVVGPVPGKAMIEKHIEHNPRIATTGMAKTRQRLINQRMMVGEHINAAVQLYTRLDIRPKLPLQAAFHEVAVQAAE